MPQTKKKTTPAARKKPATVKREEDAKKKKNQALLKEINGFILVFLGVFLFYCIFAENAGMIGGFIANLMLKLTGTAGRLIFAGAVLINGILFLGKFKPFTEYKGSAYLYIVVLNLLTIAGFRDKTLAAYTLLDADFYFRVLDHITPGGLIGQFLAKLYSGLLSEVGAWLLVICITIISFILIFRKGMTEMFKPKERSPKVNGLPDKKTSKAAENLMYEIAQQDGTLFIKSNAANKNKKERVVRDNSPLDDFVFKETQNPQNPPSAPPRFSPLDAFTKDEPSKTPKKEIESTNNEGVFEFKEKKVEKNIETPVKPAADKSIKKSTEYVFPPIMLLDNTKSKSTGAEKQEILSNAAHLEKTLGDFSIEAKVAEVAMGPTVTRYELQLQPGIRVSKVVNLSDDIAMALAAQRVRIEAPIPGKSAIGIEVPNKEVAIVKLSQIIQTPEFENHKSPLAVALGKKLSGDTLVMDITNLPHLLIAGATGSGKSVCINTIIMSILYHSSPEEVKMILIDPKMVELNVYNEIPHLLIPVVTDPKLASGALNWAVREMTSRYEIFVESKVRDIEGYNDKMKAEKKDKMPHIVLIIDELNDLMMVSSQQVEAAICRLAQLARAAGIHLVLATQRPSVNVITGTIKANIPSRIAFSVTSQVDSRTILDMGGAEKLLGRGDMLYFASGMSKPIRAQCSYISEKEVERVVEFIKKNRSAVYDDGVIEDIKTGKENQNGGNVQGEDSDDELLPKAMEIAFEKGQISTSMIQRRLRLGYNRAGRIVDQMEQKGYITPPEGSKPRRILISSDDYYAH